MTDYAAAYRGILTEEELRRAEGEAAEFARDLPPLKYAPGLVRQTLGRLPDGVKERVIAAGAASADQAGRDYTAITGEVFDPARHKSHAAQREADGLQDYASRLNYRTFLLSGDAPQLTPARSAHDISALFPKGQEPRWPTLILASNSNLVSPQSFYDSFLAARKLTEALGAAKGGCVVAGTYFSRRHLHANALDTTRRHRELAGPDDRFRHVSPAADIQASLLLDLLLERGEDGAVITQGSKPLLRADAKEVLGHVVAYGYSGAHLANKDAFRLLHDLLSDGDVAVQSHRGGEAVTRDSTAADARELLSQARLIGVAGADKAGAGPENGMPREVNFVAREDFSSSLHGPRFFTAAQVIPVTMKDDRGDPIHDPVGRHAQASYLEAIFSRPNARALEQARSQLQPVSHIR